MCTVPLVNADMLFPKCREIPGFYENGKRHFCSNFFVYFLAGYSVLAAPLLIFCRPFCISERCLDSNPEIFRSKQVCYQLSHPFLHG